MADNSRQWLLGGSQEPVVTAKKVNEEEVEAAKRVKKEEELAKEEVEAAKKVNEEEEQLDTMGRLPIALAFMTFWLLVIQKCEKKGSPKKTWDFQKSIQSSHPSVHLLQLLKRKTI